MSMQQRAAESLTLISAGVQAPSINCSGGGGGDVGQAGCVRGLLGAGDAETAEDYQMALGLLFKLVIGVLYAVIFFLGVFGNALVCFVVARSRQMQTVTNLFITNLALSDMLLCVLAVPFTPLYTFLGSWVFGHTLCRMVPYAQGVSIYISTLTLTGIAVDRFLVIIYPFKPRMKIGLCIGIILAIWLLAVALTLPYGIFMLPYLGPDGVFYCEENWPDGSFRVLFSLFTSFLQFVVPFFVITVCYICVWDRLSDRARMKPGSKSSRREEADRERKKRTNRMLIAMVAIFGVSWLPLNIYNVVEDYYEPHWGYSRETFFIVHCLAMSSTCYNPFLYAWLNDNFRKEFKQVLPCFGRMGGVGESGRRGTIEAGLAAEGCCRSERTCNGAEQTVQESLLPSQLAKQYSGCEMISLEPTTNFTKDLD